MCLAVILGTLEDLEVRRVIALRTEVREGEEVEPELAAGPLRLTGEEILEQDHQLQTRTRTGEDLERGVWVPQVADLRG